jgi:hypothetical protein
MKKTTVQLPNLAGEFGAPGSEKITILLLGAKSNHPMGTFAPDFPKVLGYLQKMSTELETDSKQDSGCKSRQILEVSQPLTFLQFSGKHSLLGKQKVE